MWWVGKKQTFGVKVKNPRTALAMTEAALVSLESFPGAGRDAAVMVNVSTQ